MTVTEQPANRKKGWVPITVRVRKSTFAELQALADARDCPQAYLIRQAIEEMLRRAR